MQILVKIAVMYYLILVLSGKGAVTIQETVVEEGKDNIYVNLMHRITLVRQYVEKMATDSSEPVLEMGNLIKPRNYSQHTFRKTEKEILLNVSKTEVFVDKNNMSQNSWTIEPEVSVTDQWDKEGSGDTLPVSQNISHSLDYDSTEAHGHEEEFPLYANDSSEDNQFFDFIEPDVKIIETQPINLWGYPGMSVDIPDDTFPSEFPDSEDEENEPHCGKQCNQHCLPFQTVEMGLGYEVRRYDRSTWASTIIVSKSRVLAGLEGYTILQEYFDGHSDPGTVMNLTLPIVSQIKLQDHPGTTKELNDIAVSMFIPKEYSNEVPRPLSNEILVDTTDVRLVFSHSFKAWVWEVTDSFLDTKVENLKKRLRKRGEAFYDRYFYLASYERPSTPSTQDKFLYEIWIYGPPFRDPSKLRPATAPRDHPRSKMTHKTKLKLCRGLECPSFDVLRVFKYGIQKRRYYDSVFATTNPVDCDFNSVAVWRGMIPLHLYKHGMNSHFEVLESTKPIGLIHIRKGWDGEYCAENLTIGIYLPKRLHSNPPSGGPPGTTQASVSIRRIDDLIVYVWPVGGYLLDSTRVHTELQQFSSRLKQFHLCFREDQYYVVVYDFIVRFHGRQNELWVLAENCRAESFVPTTYWGFNKKLVPPEEFLSPN